MKKTKRFLLATSGATVDGREVKTEWLQEIASSYNPQTYGARLNIEHIRGLSSDGPFRAYGDVLELSTEDVTVNFNGQDEVRTGLYGVFEVTEDAENLNKASQKVYPSIEVNPNFADKGYAYLMGCALTDTPAAIGTERLQFNRQTPGTLSFSAKDFNIDAALLEFADAPPNEVASGEVKNFMDKASAFFDKFSGSKPETKPETKEAPKTQNDDINAQFAAIGTMMIDGFKTFSDQIASHNLTAVAANKALTDELSALKKNLETSEGNFGSQRPASAGEQIQGFDC